MEKNEENEEEVANMKNLLKGKIEIIRTIISHISSLEQQLQQKDTQIQQHTEEVDLAASRLSALQKTLTIGEFASRYRQSVMVVIGRRLGQYWPRRNLGDFLACIEDKRSHIPGWHTGRQLPTNHWPGQ